MKINGSLIIAFTSFILFISCSTNAQRGYPTITNYNPEHYNSHSQVWSIIQDNEDILYFGTSTGLLTYDGVDWESIQGTTTIGPIRSLDIDSIGQIYVGAQNNIGYLNVSHLGQLEYVSLLEHLPPGDRAIGDVWKTYCISSGVYFITNRYILRWKDNQLHLWKHSGIGRYRGLGLGNNLYIHNQGPGQLYKVVHDSITQVSIPQWDSISGGVSIFPVIPYDTDHLKTASEYLLPNFNGEFLLFSQSKNSLTKIWTELSRQHQLQMIFTGNKLPDNSYTIGSFRSGWYNISAEGQLKLHLTTDKGLINNSIFSEYIDHIGNTWLGTNNGIAYIESSNPITTYTQKTGYPGSAEAITRFQNKLYIGTFEGLFVLNEDHSFQAIQGPDQVWEMLPFTRDGNESLLIAARNGLYESKNGQLTKLLDIIQPRTIFVSPSQPSILYVGGSDYFKVCQNIAGQWYELASIDVSPAIVASITEDKDQKVWIGTNIGGVYQYEFTANYQLKHQIHFDSMKRAYVVKYINTEMLADKLLVAYDKGLSYYDREEQSFIPFLEFGKQFTDSLLAIEEIHQVGNRLWFRATHDTARVVIGYISPNAQKEWNWTHTPFKSLPMVATTGLYPESDGSVWVGGSTALSYYRPDKQKNYTKTFNTHIRKVFLNSDSLIFGGSYHKTTDDSLIQKIATQPTSMIRNIDYKSRDLTFHFATSYYEKHEANQFSYKLEGHDETWSKWSKEHKRRYTNLWEGSYIFKVRARNVYGTSSKIATYQFVILPPWYRTIYAYTLYALLFIGMVYSIVRVNSRLLNKKLARQQAINQRLTEADRLKDEFLANTSHELRTPLNGIIGLVDSLLDGVSGQLPDKAQKDLRMVSISSKRLSGLVNDILDLSRLREKDILLQKKTLDVKTVVDVIIHLTTPLIKEKDLFIENKVTQGLPLVDVDENRLQQILLNIVGNAIKFTKQGHITIDATTYQKDATKPMVKVAVKDTGIGIPVDKQQRIFDSFEQAEGDTARTYGGTGLGLAISKKLVELHGGTIWVNSHVGEGSTFHFTLPISQEQNIDISTSQIHPLKLPLLQTPTNTETPSVVSKLQLDHNFKILVVDDEPINLQVLENQLLLSNYQVTKAHNGIEALQTLENNGPFDLVILDVMMPKLSGYDVCAQIRNHYLAHELPILLLTAKNQLTDLITGFESGANDYMTKPFSKGELLSRVRLHLDLLSAVRELMNQNIILEQKVKERTAEISAQNEEIKTQRDHIEAQNSQLKNQAGKLYTANEHLQELSKFKESMLGLIVHDLKNPLNLIFHHAQATQVKQAANQMLHLVMNILDTQKLQETQLKIAITTQPITSLINEAIRQVSFLAERKNIKIERTIPHQLHVNADTDLILRVLVNLTTNAIKFSPINSSIQIYVNKDPKNQRAKINITDQGKGIPEHLHHVIFDPFQQNQAKDSSYIKSTGLGLSFCKLAVLAHREEIGVNSTVDHGSNFWFTLSITNSPTKNLNQDVAIIEEPSAMTLSPEDIDTLQTIQMKLAQTAFYEYDQVVQILEGITSKRPTIQHWKAQVLQAVMMSNGKLYHDLTQKQFNN